MHITEYRRVLMGPSKKFQPDRLELMLRKIYSRFNRRALGGNSVVQKVSCREAPISAVESTVQTVVPGEFN